MPLYIEGVFRVIGLLWDSFPEMPEMTDVMQYTWLGRETMLYWIPSILAILGNMAWKEGVSADHVTDWTEEQCRFIDHVLTTVTVTDGAGLK